MDGLWIILFALSGVDSFRYFRISVPTLEVTARPGDNITLYCDRRPSPREYILWFNKCSHESQPAFVLNVKERPPFHPADILVRPHFEFVKNNSSDSYDLLIKNITESDEGFYFCGTEESVEENTRIYRYSNITTRIRVDSSEPHPDVHETLHDWRLCWTLLFSLGPAVAILSSMFVFQFCRETAKRLQVDEKRTDTGRQIPPIQDEDVLHAALELHQATQRPKRMKTWSSDITVCTYSVIRTFDPTM